jgi:hypothetical protein
LGCRDDNPSFFILHTSGIYYDRYSKLQESTEYHQSGTGVVGGFL